MRVVLLLAVAACAPQSCGPGWGTMRRPDSSVVDGACNVLEQTGCGSNQKCTWVIDAADAASWIGHISCTPDGAQAIGSACTRRAPGTYSGGYDDCVRGAYCLGPAAGGSGTCEAICDLAGGAPACATSFGCTPYDGVLGPQGMTPLAGLCAPTCDPLADNNFLGSAGDNRTGSACGSGSGCYGLPDGSAGPTVWTCRPQRAYSRVHRSSCDATIHPGDTAACATSLTMYPANGCAAGYEPLIYDADGTTYVDCIALCRPATCYNTGSGSAIGSSSCGTGSDVNVTGTAPYQCNTQRLQYAAFDSTDPAAPWSATAPTVNNGEQCYYSWLFELDASQALVPSATSDTVGFCLDHALYTYPTGSGSETAPWPRCDYIGLGSNGYHAQPFDAALFGCVDIATARAAGDLGFDGKLTFPRLPVRMPYHR